MLTIAKLVTCLWFDGVAEDAARYYVGIFEGSSKIGRVTHYGHEGEDIHGQKAGTVLTVAFELNGMQFTALNGGPHFKFNEAVSLQVMCDSQTELDYYWDKLSLGGDPKAQQCGWLKDKYGLSWQIVPSKMADWMDDRDPGRAGRVMKAFMPMKKLDIAQLERAAAG